MFISQSQNPFLNTNYREPEFITGKYGSCDLLDYRRSKILVSAESDRFIPFGVPLRGERTMKSRDHKDMICGHKWRENLAPKVKKWQTKTRYCSLGDGQVGTEGWVGKTIIHKCWSNSLKQATGC